MSTSPYKRRRPRILKNLWIYRRLVTLAFVVGLVLWFMIANKTAVEIVFPFGLGKVNGTTGVLILASALAGSIVTFLIMTLVHAIKRREPGVQSSDEPGPRESRREDDDRPPPDYAAKATDGISNSRWE